MTPAVKKLTASRLGNGHIAIIDTNQGTATVLYPEQARALAERILALLEPDRLQPESKTT